MSSPSGPNEAMHVSARPAWVRFFSRRAQYLLDLLVLVAAFVLAYGLRFDFAPPYDVRMRALSELAYVVLLQFLALHLAGVYSFVWRYVGLREVSAFLRAAVWSLLPVIVLRFALPASYGTWKVPVSVAIFDTILAFGGVLAIRVFRRVVFERYERGLHARDGSGHAAKRVLLVGAGRAGNLAAKEIQDRIDLGLSIVGFVDDDAEKHGSVIQGVRVLGATGDLPTLVADLDIDHVIITIAQATRDQLRQIVEVCESIPIKMRIIPGLYEILGGKVEVSRIRDVDIEDLLGREPVQLEESQIRTFLAGKTIMVTGAGGSIGSELVRQVARFGAGRVLLVERAENALFVIHRELREHWEQLDCVPLVADIADLERMRRLLAVHKPSVIVHAAAHKHVPMMESNPCEAIKNNSLATARLGELAGEAGVEAFILISTDKAVRPTSVMGASKRLAEIAVERLNQRFATRFVAVRFGNVMGSAGSVIPIFRDQILHGGPVTVTHPDMVRYFMTIPEASQLVLQAGAMGNGGEIFILDMGEPVKILDLAQEMIRLFGLRPYEDVDIVITGIRPGEKLYEELQTTGETIAKTRHPKIFIGNLTPSWSGDYDDSLRRLEELAVDSQEGALRQLLNSLLPDARIYLPPTVKRSGSTRIPEELRPAKRAG